MKILIAYDGSGYSRNAIYDLQCAGFPNEAHVRIISVSEAWLSPEMDGSNHEAHLDDDILEYFHKHSEQIDRNIEETRGILIEAKENLRKLFPKWSIETVAFKGSPAQVILQAAAEFAPDLIVVGALGLSSDNRPGLGSVSQKILSYSKVSTRIVRSKAETDPDRLKIAICFDNSPFSLEAVKTVVLRKWSGKPEVRLFVVTDPLIALIPGRVFQLIPGIPEGRMKGEKKWVESLADKSLRMLRNAGLTASVDICSGNPRIMLLSETKEWNADIIFIGANSGQCHSLGSVASGVSARASCSVEVIKKS
ncbi:MAG: universal stress protein [Pyrinomonadaceae bacterium]